MKFLFATFLKRFYQFAGILPIELSENLKACESRRLKRYSIYLFIFLSSFIFSVFYEKALFFNSGKSNVGETVDFIQLVSMRFSSIIIIYEAYLTQNYLIDYFNHLHDVDKLMMKIDVKINFRAEQSRDFIKIIITLVFYILCELNVLLMYKYRQSMYLFRYWISYTPFYIFCCLRYLQLINFIMIIKRRIDIVNRKLKEINLVLPHSFLKLENLRKISYKLYIMSQLINISFGVSTLINIANDFITVTLNSYFIFVSFQKLGKRSFIKIVESISWSAPHLMNIIVLSLCCQLTLLSTFRTAMLLHRICFNIKNSQHNMFMSQFSLQLLHQKIHFHAFGFFDIDFTLLFAIAATVTTYLVILIQFHLSEQTKGTETSFN